MKKFLMLVPIIALGGCQSLSSLTSLSPMQQASLACLATTMGAQIAANHTTPIRAATVQSDGSILCTFVTGASVVVGAK